HEQFLDLVCKHFGDMKPMSNGFYSSQPKVVSRIILRNKKALEQVQICVGVPSHPIAHEKRHASYILNTLLGGGMSSRLFQNIRERQGLAYAVFSELNPYRDTGCLSIYAGTSLESARQVVESITNEFRQLKAQPVGDEELRRAKDHLKGSLMLGLESTSSRMSNLARQEMYFNRFFTMDELLESIETVSADDVQRIAQTFFDPKQIALTVLGNLENQGNVDCQFGNATFYGFTYSYTREDSNGNLLTSNVPGTAVTVQFSHPGNLSWLPVVSFLSNWDVINGEQGDIRISYSVQV